MLNSFGLCKTERHAGRSLQMLVQKNNNYVLVKTTENSLAIDSNINFRYGEIQTVSKPKTRWKNSRPTNHEKKNIEHQIVVLHLN